MDPGSPGDYFTEEQMVTWELDPNDPASVKHLFQVRMNLRHFDEENEPPERTVEQRVTMRLGGARSGTIVLKTQQLAVPDILKPFDCEVRFGQRVAIVGPNGSGKSHFLRLLAGLAVRHAGELVLGARVKVGYFSQTHDMPGLNGKTVMDVCRDVGLDRGRPEVAADADGSGVRD